MPVSRDIARLTGLGRQFDPVNISGSEKAIASAPPFQDSNVAQAFAAFPASERQALLLLRARIFEIAAETEGVGRIEETLKWSQPAYLTPDTGSSTTLRLGLPGTGGIALYVHCQTTILREFRDRHPDGFTFEGNRAIHLDPDAPLPIAELDQLIHRALTYKRRR